MADISKFPNMGFSRDPKNAMDALELFKRQGVPDHQVPDSRRQESIEPGPGRTKTLNNQELINFNRDYERMPYSDPRTMELMRSMPNQMPDDQGGAELQMASNPMAMMPSPGQGGVPRTWNNFDALGSMVFQQPMYNEDTIQNMVMQMLRGLGNQGGGGQSPMGQMPSRPMQPFLRGQDPYAP